MEHIEIKRDGIYCYSIWLEEDFSRIGNALESLHTDGKRLCVVSDSNVSELYLEDLKDALRPYCKEVYSFVFPAGESSKTVDTVKDLYEYLILSKFDRKDMLVALGGGVVGDLTGFTAATYLRGIDFIQIPTTLLAQVDSSIGGKTGVDFASYKNMVGAFHMPKLVYMNLGVLKTLPERQFSAGMAEIIKHGLIQDKEYLQGLMDHADDITARDYAMLRWMVDGSCRIKGRVVEEDPTEKGIRAWLNFGHTIGHSVEKLKEFTLYHGECVSIGIVAAAWISRKRGCLCEEEFQMIERLLEDYGLPIRVSGLCASEILLDTKLDKKMEAGQIKFVLLDRIGAACISKNVDDDELMEAIRYICEE